MSQCIPKNQDYVYTLLCEFTNISFWFCSRKICVSPLFLHFALSFWIAITSKMNLFLKFLILALWSLESFLIEQWNQCSLFHLFPPSHPPIRNKTKEHTYTHTHTKKKEHLKNKIKIIKHKIHGWCKIGKDKSDYF